MTRLHMTTAVLLVLLACGICRAEAPPPEPLPTSEEIHKLFDAGQYPAALQKLARVLRLRGDAARAYDRRDLLLLKGNIHLQQKEMSLAMSTLTSAVQEIDAQTTPKDAAVTRATLLLLKRSKSLVFTPRTSAKGQAPQPLSILDLTKRTACFTGLFEDAKVDCLAKVKIAKAAKTLGPIIDAINAVSEMRSLELAAFDQELQSAAQLEGLTQQAKELMTRAVQDLKTRADKDHASANELIRNPDVILQSQRLAPASYHKQGLTGLMGNELKQIITDSDRIGDAAKQFADLSKSTAKAFDEVGLAAEKVSKSAKETLDDNYNGSFTK